MLGEILEGCALLRLPSGTSPQVIAPFAPTLKRRYHPSDQGHKAMAEALVAPLLRAVGEVQAQRLLPPAVLQALLLPLAGDTDLAYMRDDARLSGLPPPMIPGNHETRTIMCAMQVLA